MSKKKRKTNFKFRFLIFLIIIYILIKLFPTIASGEVKTRVLEKETLIESIHTKGYLLKNEYIYKATNKGVLEIFVHEGERVKAGTEVALLTSVGDDLSLQEELNQVEKSIEEIEKVKAELLNIDSGTDIDSMKENLRDEIQENTLNGNIEEVRYLKEKLLSLNEIENPGEEGNREKKLNELKDKRDNILENISRSIHKYYIPDGGIISYKIDGYEESYVPEDFERYTYEYFEEDHVKEIDKIEVNGENEENKYDVELNQGVFKLIDNFEWYLCIEIDDLKDIKEIEENGIMTVKLENGEVMDGRVQIINKFKNRGVIVLKFTSKLHDFYDDREIGVELIKSKKLGYKIQKSALLKENDKTGIRIRDLSGIIRYKPVKIIGEDEECYYLDPGDENSNIFIDKKTYRTLTDFDEVVLKPKSVREGEIVN